jgi:Ser/Thr protein kinase RdoA (MazF antagonist)
VPQPATLTHDDLHHGNVLFRHDHYGWRLAALLDWDKSWAGPGRPSRTWRGWPSGTT